MSDDPVRIQINVKIKKPRGKKVPKRIIEEAVERWAATGQESPFIQIRAVHWLNPERKHAELAVWKVALAGDVGPEEYLRISIAWERMTGDTIERARRSLRLDTMPSGAFAALVFIKEVVTVKKRKAKSGKRAKGGAKNVKKRKGKVSQVRRSKRKNKGK